MKNLLILVTGSVIAFSACQKDPRDTKKEEVEKQIVVESDLVELTSDQLKNAGIETGALQQRDMHSALKVNGKIDVPPENKISISLPMGGYVKKMSLIPGMYVKKGSVLATVEDQQYIQLQQDYLTAQSRLKYLTFDYSRQKELNKTKATSDKLFQQAESEYESQKVLVNALAEKLRLIGLSLETLTEETISRSIQVYAPISGYVTLVNVNPGKYVNASDVLFELINPQKSHLSLTVFENDAPKLVSGEKIMFTTNGQTEKVYTARIRFVTPNITDDRSTEVHCDIISGGIDLIPGTFVNATIQLNHARVATVPDEAVVKWRNENYLFVKESGNTFRQIKVEIGAVNDGFVEIKSPAALGDVVIKNAYALLMKMRNSGDEG